MALSLSLLCKSSDEKHKLRLIAGKNGLENQVRWVHMVEDTEVPDFLHGNELVFTTGIGNYQRNWLLSFVKRLKENNAAGVVMNIGPYITDIPPQVIVYCEQNDFPLLTIPWTTRIIDVSYEFCRLIINAEKVEQSLTEAFKNLIDNPNNKDMYMTTLARAGFIDDSSYTVVSIVFKEDGADVTSKFITQNNTMLTRILRVNTMPKATYHMDNTLNIVYQNISETNLEIMIGNIEKLCSKTENTKHYIGISEEKSSFRAISTLHKQAQSAILIAEIKNENFLNYKDLGVYKLILDVRHKDTLKEYYAETLANLIKYDKDHQSDYCETLRKYCFFNGSVSEVAEDLGVHRNTINYKMKKIKEILGRELDYHFMTDLMLCFKISNIIN